jgi:PEP-CTERM motif
MFSTPKKVAYAWIATPCLALGLLASAHQMAVADVLVDPANMGNWIFLEDNSGSSGAGSFVQGPGTAPLGTGSAQLSVGDSNSGEILFNYGTLAGTPLSDITALSYQSYVVSSSSSAQSPALDFDINLAGATNYQGRLIFEPYLAVGTVTAGQWNTWNALTLAGWWFSKPSVFTNGCTGALPCTWAQVLADYPGVEINNDQGGGFGFKVGSGWTDFVGNVDDLTIDVSETDPTYNFDPNPVPEPASASLLGIALIGCWMFARRRGKAAI